MWQYRHDAENRLVEVKLNGNTLARYVYNGDGQRVLAVVGDEKTVYIGDYFEARSDEDIPLPTITPLEGYNLYFPLVTGGSMPETGRTIEPPPHTEWRTYYSLGGLRVGMRVQGGSRAAGGVQYALLSDHLGSVVGSVNRLGTLTSSVRYGAWGDERVSTGTMPTDRGYTGQLEAEEVGLYFYNARWYDAELARFAEADSIVPDAGSTVAYERYTYALNNPIRYNDPSGHWPDWFNPKGWLDYGMGAGSQFVDDMSFGLFSAITGDLDFVLNDSYQQGREVGRTASIVVSSVETVLGTAAFLNGIGLIGPTAGGSLAAALPSGGTSLIFGGIAIPVELAAAGAGVVAAGHGIGMAVYIVNNPLQNSNENITIPQGKVNQVTRRGWSLEQIIEVQKNPTYTRSTANNPNVYNRANGNPVTYYYRSDGHYVVIDDITHQVVQVSNTHNPGWIDEMTNKPITRRVPGGTQ